MGVEATDWGNKKILRNLDKKKKEGFSAVLSHLGFISLMFYYFSN